MTLRAAFLSLLCVGGKLLVAILWANGAERKLLHNYSKTNSLGCRYIMKCKHVIICEWFGLLSPRKHCSPRSAHTVGQGWLLPKQAPRDCHTCAEDRFAGFAMIELSQQLLFRYQVNRRKIQAPLHLGLTTGPKNDPRVYLGMGGMLKPPNTTPHIKSPQL